MIQLDSIQTAAALDYLKIADEIDSILTKKRSDIAHAPERIVMQTNDTDSLLVMPAFDDEWMITKLVTVHRNNATMGLPTIQGEVLCIRKVNGRRVMQLDGATVTAFRTASLSLVAIRKMGFENATSFVIIGSGVQARAHVSAVFAMNPTCTIHLVARNTNDIEGFVRELQTRQLHITLGSDLHEILANCDVVITATSSMQPIVPESITENRRDSLLIVAVGSHRSEMRELPSNLVNASTTIVVDTLEGAKLEAGDLIQANVEWDRVTELASLSRLEMQPNGIHLFKSVGNALWDLAAARTVLQHYLS